jgi:hypothetical protein
MKTEIDYLVKDIQKQSCQDTIGFGVPIDSFNHELIKQLKDYIEVYDGKVITELYSTGATQRISISGLLHDYNFEYVQVNKKFRKDIDPMGILSVYTIDVQELIKFQKRCAMQA